MQLFICEKPSQARDYAKALGIVGGSKNGYIDNGKGIQITWCIGHLLTPLDPDEYDEKYAKWNLKDLPILPREKWAWKPNPKTKSQLKVVKDLLKTAKEVIIASDADREGELIVVSLLEKFNYKGKRSRVWTSALDVTGLNKAISNKKDASYTHNEYLAASTRQKLDWIFGMSLTRGMSVANQGRVVGVLSVGRVQTAVLNLIVLRDTEIENFKSKNFYDMTATFTNNGGFIKTEYVIPKSFLDEEEGKCLDKSKIEEVLQKIKGKDGIITKNEKTRKKESAPLLFSLDELQKECDSKFGFGATQTLDLAQSLYETHKATSYPRSDCQYLTLDQFKEVGKVFEAMKKSDPNTKEITDFLDNADLKKKTKVWNQKKVEASAHHAIIPTMTPFNISALNDNEAKVYDLIRKRYIAQFYPEAESDSTKIEITCEGEIFKTSGTMPVSAGWKTIIGKKSESKELPLVNQGDTVLDAKPKLEIKNTKPPARFTDGTLIDAMKNAGKFVEDKNAKSILKGTEGIGTVATRANILDVLHKRDYAKKEKKSIISTDKGRGLIQYVPKKSKSIEMTAYWEGQLEQISKGTLEPNEFLLNQEKELNEMIDEIRSGNCTFKETVGSLYNCPNCDAGLSKVKSKKNGKIYWRCMAGDNCTSTNSIFPDSRGKPSFPKKVDQGDVEYTCTKCNKGKLLRMSGQYGTYWKCQDKECGENYTDVDMKPVAKEVVSQGDEEFKCPECSKNNLTRRSGKFGYYWRCSGTCKTNYKEVDMKPLIVKKETSEHKCPNCKTGYLVQRGGENKKFWGCNAYPKCRTAVSDKDNKPVLK